VRVHEIRAVRRARRRATKRSEKRRNEQRAPWRRAQVPDDPVPVGDPEIPERRRRDNRNLDAARADTVYRIGDETPRGILRPAGKRRRQDRDLQATRLANTIGSASASAANP
jgi:hypothetical protein